MSELTLANLLAMRPIEYSAVVKARLRNDEEWVILLDPVLANRTRGVLNRIIDSIEAQKERAREEGQTDTSWVHRMNTLHRYVKQRLEAMGASEGVIESRTKEARAWKAFGARLAAALADEAWEAIDEIHTPYGQLTARQWLESREAKGSIQ